MDFTIEGLSWGNVYQKIEKMYKNNDLVQIPSKYADVVGKHFRDIIDEVVGDWLDPAGDCVKGPHTKDSIDGDIVTKVGENLKEGLDEKFSDDNVSTCVEVESNPSSVRNLSLTSSDQTQDLSYKNEFDERNGESVPIIETNCSDAIDGNSENSSSSVASLASLPNACPLADETLKLESFESKSVEGRSPIETCGAGGTHTSQEFIFPRGCPVDEHELQIKQDKSEASGREMEEIPDCFDGDDNSNSADVLDLNTEVIEEFQDLDIHDSWMDNEDYELAMISYQKSRTSYKNKFGASLIKKLRQLKGHKVPNSYSIIVRKQGRQGNALLMDNKVQSVHDSLESDWELL